MSHSNLTQTDQLLPRMLGKEATRPTKKQVLINNLVYKQVYSHFLFQLFLSWQNLNIPEKLKIREAWAGSSAGMNA